MRTKAAVLRKIDSPLVIEELKVPKLNPGQVLVKILYSGLCRSNLNEISGRKGADFIPHLTGHEASGIVLEVGSGVSKVTKGDYVVCSWIKGSGLEVPVVKYGGGSGSVNAGACATFIEHAVISENRIVRISEKVNSDAAALLGCAVPTGAGIIDNEIITKHDTKIAVFGVGGIGASALMRAAALNLDCTAFDVVPWKLAWAKVRLKIKALHFSNFAMSRNGIFDFAIECSGNKFAMEMTINCLKNDGVAIIAGNLKPGECIFVDPFEFIMGKKLKGSWGGKCVLDVDVPFYAKEHLDGRLPIEKLITKIYPFDQINEGLKDLEEGKLIRGIVKIG